MLKKCSVDHITSHTFAVLRELGQYPFLRLMLTQLGRFYAVKSWRHLIVFVFIPSIPELVLIFQLFNILITSQETISFKFDSWLPFFLDCHAVRAHLEMFIWKLISILQASFHPTVKAQVLSKILTCFHSVRRLTLMKPLKIVITIIINRYFKRLR